MLNRDGHLVGSIKTIQIFCELRKKKYFHYYHTREFRNDKIFIIIIILIILIKKLIKYIFFKYLRICGYPRISMGFKKIYGYFLNGYLASEQTGRE